MSRTLLAFTTHVTPSFRTKVLPGESVMPQSWPVVFLVAQLQRSGSTSSSCPNN